MEKCQSVRGGLFRFFPLPRTKRKKPNPLSWLSQLVARGGRAVPSGAQRLFGKIPCGILRQAVRSAQPAHTSQLAKETPLAFARSPAHHPQVWRAEIVFPKLSSKNCVKCSRPLPPPDCPSVRSHLALFLFTNFGSF